MASIKINEEELEALAELPHMHRCLYLFGIRPYADYATGIAGGPKRRISYQSLSEAVYVPPTPGTREEYRAGKQQLRRALHRLQSTGVLRIQSEGRHLVLALPLMETDNSTQKQADTRPTQGRHTKADTEADTPKARHNGSSTHKADTQADTRPTSTEGGQADIHPGSGVREDSPPDGGSSCTSDNNARASETVIALPLNDGTEYAVSPQDRDHWADLYPAVDIDQALRTMRGWLEANPAKRKTRRGIKRFITNWLSREQDRGGNNVTRLPANKDGGEQRKRRAF